MGARVKPVVTERGKEQYKQILKLNRGKKKELNKPKNAHQEHDTKREESGRTVGDWQHTCTSRTALLKLIPELSLHACSLQQASTSKSRGTVYTVQQKCSVRFMWNKKYMPRAQYAAGQPQHVEHIT